MIIRLTDYVMVTPKCSAPNKQANLRTSIARWTDALEGVHLIDAGASLFAGTASALVNVHLAVGARVAGHAGAEVLAHLVPAGAPVVARAHGALVDVGVAVQSAPALQALALVGGVGHHIAAVGVVLTGIRLAPVDRRLALAPGPADAALALKLSEQVLAGAAIGAGI